MKQILWQTSAPALDASLRSGGLVNTANGGNAYEYVAIEALREAYPVRHDAAAVRREGEHPLRYWWRMSRSAGVADLVVKDLYALALGTVGQAPVEIGMIHHIDRERRKGSAKHWLFFNRLIQHLTSLDVVVTVSAYWKRELEKLGCRRVEVIYNAFDPEAFWVSRSEVEAFRRRYDLPEDRPLVYIGNATRIKGVDEVYEALKEEGYTLVMTGRTRDTDIPVPWFNLDYRDYLCLLHACDVVVSMSRLLEGWSRVVHEAMLCRTPVIGSGTGGMEELLKGGRQRVVTDPRELRNAVRSVLQRPADIGAHGYAFAKQFDTAYFARAWRHLAEEFLEAPAATHQVLAR